MSFERKTRTARVQHIGIRDTTNLAPFPFAVCESPEDREAAGDVL
jgi:hypothetical protein